MKIVIMLPFDWIILFFYVLNLRRGGGRYSNRIDFLLLLIVFLKYANNVGC